MGTILNKANEILAEKTSKVIPGNIKSGVTMFGVTGTYEGEGGGGGTTVPTLIRYDFSRAVAFDCIALADLLDDRLTSDEKLYVLSKDTSNNLEPAIMLTCGFKQSDKITGYQFGLSFKENENGLVLNFNQGDTLIQAFEIDDDNSNTDVYYHSEMTVNDLITLLRKIGVVTGNVPSSFTQIYYLYDIIAIKLNFMEEYASQYTLLLQNITNNFFVVEDVDVGLLDDGVRYNLNLGTAGEIIDKYTTAEDKAKVLNLPQSSGADTNILLLTNNLELHPTSGSLVQNCEAYLSTDGTGRINLTFVQKYTDQRFYVDTVFEEGSDYELPNPFTVADLIALLKYIGNVEYTYHDVTGLSHVFEHYPEDFMIVEDTSIVIIHMYEKIIEVLPDGN